MSHFHAPIAEQIWDMKYRLKEADGTPIDGTVEDTWRRIANALAEAEDGDPRWQQDFYNALEGFRFLPAGRIVAGAGSGRKVTLSNCFTMGTIPDSMDGIFEMLKEAALTMQQGGGIGYDFSTIRPKGALVKGVAADASGPLTFMDCWDAMCRTVMSAGSRRGAMMATMRCDHPDIEAFIEAKHDAARLRMFNLSVLVTDAFMEAVKNNETWELAHEVAPPVAQASPNANKHGQRADGRYVYTTVPAQYLWDKIMRSTYDYAEPGCIFIDRVNEKHNIRYLESIATTNPCGEKPMGPYASCLLGSINLAALVQNPFSHNAGIDRDELRDLVFDAIRMMDNVVDVGGFPLEAQRQKAQADRQLGLGITGLADALAMCKIRYGTEAAAAKAGTWMKLIDEAAYEASIALARQKGSFPTFNADKFLAEGTHASTLPRAIREAIREHGIRNALVTSVAPTGTISLYAGNVSSGIEPIFATSYTRKVLQPDGSRTEERVVDYAVALYEQMYEDLELDVDPDADFALPDYFVTAQTLTPEEHIRMQAAVQKHVDSSISKTTNLPEDISFEAFKDVYWLAYESGCKGCTTYRPNEVTGSVLSVEEKPVENVTQAQHYGEGLLARPDALPGATYKLKWPGSEHALYVTVTDLVENDLRRPYEVFVNSKNMEHFTWTTALTRMISAVFRHNTDSTFVVEELKAVFDPRGGAWMQGGYVPSVVAAIGQIIERHMKAIGYLPSDEDVLATADAAVSEIVASAVPIATCPKCSGVNYVAEGGCKTCRDCGYSACG